MKKKRCAITFDDIKNICCEHSQWFKYYIKSRLKEAGFKDTDIYEHYYDIPKDCLVFTEFKT